MPIRKGDEVKIKRGSSDDESGRKGVKGRTGKVMCVYRKKYCIHVEGITREKCNHQPIQIPINASNVEIVKLKMDKSRKAILDRKDRVKIGQGKGNVTLHENLANVD